MSRRLTPEDKQRIKQETEPLQNIVNLGATDRFIDSKDGKEYHEGMAAGLLVATDIINSVQKMEPAAAIGIWTAVLRCIQETEKAR